MGATFRQYRDIEANEQLLVFADTAAGGNDYCAAQFLSATKLDVPLVFHSKVTATEMTPALHPVLEELAEVTGIKPLVAYERNNGGSFEVERLASMNRLGKYDMFTMPTFGNQVINAIESNVKKLGWDTNSATRPMMLSALKDAIDHGQITLYDKETVKELYSFVVVQTSSSWKAQAERGAHDDLVMALAGAWQLYLTAPQIIRLQPVFTPRQRTYDPVTGRLIS